MIKRDKNFKLSKEAKRQLARYIDPHKRGLFKNSMIEAEILGSIVPKKSKKDKDSEE